MSVSRQSTDIPANAAPKGTPHQDMLEAEETRHPWGEHARQALPFHPFAQLQQSVGNQAVQRSLELGLDPGSMGRLFQLQPIIGNQGVTRRLQTKLKINTPGDHYEQEADRVAEQVMRMPAPTTAATPAVRSAVASSAVSPAVSGVQRKCACGGTCSECQTEQPDHEYELLHMKPAGSAGLGQTAAPDGLDQVLSSPGKPLDPRLRQDMEQRFGYYFSQVRVHVDERAADSAAALGASAYTLGQHVVFSRSAFDPVSGKGRRLIAHELAHTIQQRAPGNEPFGKGPAQEREADRAASPVLAGGAVPTLTPSGLAVARQPLENMPPSVEWVDGQIALVYQQLQMPVLPPQLKAALLVRLHQLQLRRTQLATGGASRGSPAKQIDPKAQAEEDKQKRRERTIKRFAKLSDDELKQKIQVNCKYHAEEPTWRNQYDLDTLVQIVEERLPNASWWRDCREQLSAPTWTWYQRGELDKLKKDTSSWKPEQQALARDLLWQWFELRKQYGGQASKEIKEKLIKLFLAYYERQLHEIDRQRMERCQGPNKPGWFETMHGKGGGADPCESWFKYPSSHGYNELTELQRSMRLAADDDDVVPEVAVWSWVQSYRMQTDPDLLAQAAIVEGVLGAVTMLATPGGEPMGRVNVPPGATPKPGGGLTEPPIQPPRPAVGNIVSDANGLPARVRAVMPNGDLVLEPLTNVPPANRSLPPPSQTSASTSLVPSKRVDVSGAGTTGPSGTPAKTPLPGGTQKQLGTGGISPRTVVAPGRDATLPIRPYNAGQKFKSVYPSPPTWIDPEKTAGRSLGQGWQAKPTFKQPGGGKLLSTVPEFFKVDTAVEVKKATLSELGKKRYTEWAIQLERRNSAISQNIKGPVKNWVFIELRGTSVEVDLQDLANRIVRGVSEAGRIGNKPGVTYDKVFFILDDQVVEMP